MLNKLFILLALVTLAASMGRPFRHRQHYQDCSCETHQYDSQPCDDSGEPTTPESEEETTPAPTKTTTAPTSTKTTTIPTTTKTTTIPTTTKTTTMSTTTKTTTIPTTTKTTAITTTPTTTTLATTTENKGCASGVPGFKRKNGWWCVLVTGITPAAYGYLGFYQDIANNNCVNNGYRLGSIETEEEWLYWKTYTETRSRYNVTGVWVAMEKYENGTYYWSDGQALPTLEYAQPKIVDANGKVAWIMDHTATTPPYGYLAVVDDSGQVAGSIVNLGICGRPGTQFT